MFSKDIPKAVVVLACTVFATCLTLAVIATDVGMTARLAELFREFPVEVTVPLPFLGIGFGRRKNS